MVVNEDSRIFWAEREKKGRGKVKFFTFTTFIGRSKQKPLNLGGLIYIINKKVYFEDFEKDSWFAKIISKKQAYQKTQFSFSIKDISKIKSVSKGSALNCISGIIDESATRELSSILKLLFQSITQIQLKGGYSLFFDIMREKEFVNAIRYNYH